MKKDPNEINLTFHQHPTKGPGENMAEAWKDEKMSSMSERARRVASWAVDVGKQHGAAERGFEASSAQLRDLLRQDLVSKTDLADNPEFFFEAHRVIGMHGEELGSGFWTRFTVQFNLCMLVGIQTGSPRQ